MMSRAICASLLLVMLAYAAPVACSNDCTNESNALLQTHTPKIKEDIDEKKKGGAVGGAVGGDVGGAVTMPHTPPPPQPAQAPAPAHSPAPAPPLLAFA